MLLQTEQKNISNLTPSPFTSIFQSINAGEQKPSMNNWWLCVTVLQNSVELLHHIGGGRGVSSACVCTAQLSWYLGHYVALCVCACWTQTVCLINTTQMASREGSAAAGPSHFLSSLVLTLLGTRLSLGEDLWTSCQSTDAFCCAVNPAQMLTKSQWSWM